MWRQNRNAQVSALGGLTQWNVFNSTKAGEKDQYEDIEEHSIKASYISRPDPDLSDVTYEAS